MRLSILLLLMISISALSSADSSNRDELVSSVMKEATGQYNSMMLEATKMGAQSTKVRGAKSNPFTDKIGEISEIYKISLNTLMNRHHMRREEAVSLLAKQVPEECQSRIICGPAERYRSFDGTCNNLGAAENKRGSANTPFLRLLSPVYENGDEPRGGKDSQLPNARKQSLAVHKTVENNDIVDQTITHMVAQFGQFLDHDITLTPEGGIQCCASAGNAPASCWQIDVAPDDEFYSGKSICLDFTRSTQYCPTNTGGIREQMNAITAYIDGSQVYGSDKRVTKMLREFVGGRLQGNSEHKNFLPWTSDVDPNIQTPGRVKAGDVRADEMPGLAVLHTLFHREHNRIAKIFEERTIWSDEVIFQETRRIVVAELQQIAYNEFLPVIFGQSDATKYKLNLPPSGYSEYNERIDATIYNEFATVAYRFGHTLVNGLIKFLINGALADGYSVRDHYFSSEKIVGETQGYEKILGGLISQDSLKYDGEFSPDLTNYLFKRVGDNIGSDLAARNIQRGRDHGIPGYGKWREFCELPLLTSWDARPANIQPEAWVNLRNLYEPLYTPSDIDLYTGGLIELPSSGGHSGDTFKCIMGIQFKNLMDGDRYFFTHANQSGSFNETQLNALRRRTLGDIICENSDLPNATERVLLSASSGNPQVSCDAESRKLDVNVFYSDIDLKGNSASGLQLISITYVFLFILLSKYVLYTF